MMIGSTLLGYLADTIGRKKSLMIVIIVSGSSFLVQAFMKNFWAYAMLQIVTGFATIGGFMLSFVICMEITGTKYSTELGILIEVKHEAANTTYAIISRIIYIKQTHIILQLQFTFFSL